MCCRRCAGHLFRARALGFWGCCEAKLIDFEKQGVAKMMRLPFQDHQEPGLPSGSLSAQEWEAVRGEPAAPGIQAVAPPAAPPVAEPSAADAGATSAMLLDAREARPFEDLLSKGRGAMPERHVQLFSSLPQEVHGFGAFKDSCSSSGSAMTPTAASVLVWACRWACPRRF